MRGHTQRWLITLLLEVSLSIPGLCLAQSRTVLPQAGSDPRGRPEVVICSQNLANYGSFAATKLRMPSIVAEDFDRKEDALVARFKKMGCDIIAVQEVLGSESEAEKALNVLAGLLKEKTGRFFSSVVGGSNDPSSRVGFLLAVDKVELLQTVSYTKLELPKLTPKQKPRMFPRGPLEVQVKVKGQGEAPSKVIALVNFHLKSKRGGSGDPSGLEWETARMEMTEALRRVAVSRFPASFVSAETILILLGDRNSNFDAASAKILEGVVSLDSFKENGPCRLSKRGVPLCKVDSAMPQKLFSCLTGDPQTQLQPGTFLHDKVYSWLDDIVMPAPSLRYAHARWDVAGDYASGVLSTPKEASDHAMVYVVLNW